MTLKARITTMENTKTTSGPARSMMGQVMGSEPRASSNHYSSVSTNTKWDERWNEHSVLRHC